MLLDRVRALFFAKVHPEPNSGCWLWAASCHDRGYGYWSDPVRKKIIKAHRASYELYIAPIPKGLCVLHRCDTPSCVNPAHLFLGTQKDNMIDRVRKGRIAKWGRASALGERHRSAKLKEADVLAIRAAQGISAAGLGRRYGVNDKTIRLILAGETWRHLLAGGPDAKR